MFHCSARVVLIAAAVILAPVGVARSAIASTGRWSSPTVLQSKCDPRKPNNCPTESAPRVALNTHGVVAATWVDPQSRVHVVVGDGHGRFGKSVTLGSGLRPAAAVSPNGGVVVAWSDAGRLRFARRAKGTSRFSSPAALVPGTQEDFVQLAAQPDGTTTVLYEHAFRDAANRYTTRLRTLALSRGGRPGTVRELGLGVVARDGFTARTSGQVAVCCVAAPTQTAPGAPATYEGVAAYAPGRGWSILVPPLGQGDDVESAAPGTGELAVGVVDIVRHGDAGSFGAPSLVRTDAAGTFGAPLVAPVVHAGRAFAPRVAIDGAGNSVLVYQEKVAPAAFRRTAPLYAVTSARLGRQTLTSAAAMNPMVLAYRDGAIAAWQAPRYRWGVAVERGGRFAAAPAPSGGPSQMGEDFVYSRAMATGGRYAALTWTAHDGSIRVSVGVL